MNVTRRCLPLVLLPSFVRGQPGVGEAEWKRFLSWFGLPHPEIRGGPPGVLAEYKKKLLADGISPADADRIVSRLRSLTETDPEFMRLNFNRIYTTADGQ